MNKPRLLNFLVTQGKPDLFRNWARAHRPGLHEREASHRGVRADDVFQSGVVPLFLALLVVLSFARWGQRSLSRAI